MKTYNFVCRTTVTDFIESYQVGEMFYSLFCDRDYLEVGICYEGDGVEVLSVSSESKVDGKKIKILLEFLKSKNIPILSTSFSHQKTSEVK